jgi:Xaa-Pro aminopeptidase
VKLILACCKDMCVNGASPHQSVLHVPYLSLPQIAIDSAVYPEGTTGLQLDVLARRALWKDGLNYLVCLSSCSITPVQRYLQHGTGHGFGSFLNVHEGPHGFSSHIPLVPGHVITNEPGFCAFPAQLITQYPLLTESSVSDLEGRWGMRIESALVVRRVKVCQLPSSPLVRHSDGVNVDQGRVQRRYLAWF